MKEIILASSSPRRKMLLEQIRIPFTTIACDIDEKNHLELSPYMYVKDMSEKKALFAKKIIKNDAIIISCDTIVTYNNKILGKPNDAIDAFNTLKSLSGNFHYVYTSLSVINITENTYEMKTVVSSTKVFIRKIDDLEILDYIKTNEPFDKAGSYAIQGIGALFVEKIEGDYYNVVGLPIVPLVSILKDFGINVTSIWT